MPNFDPKTGINLDMYPHKASNPLHHDTKHMLSKIWHKDRGKSESVEAKSLHQILQEMPRTSEKADKLFHYILKRRGNTDSYDTKNLIKQKPWGSKLSKMSPSEIESSPSTHKHIPTSKIYSDQRSVTLKTMRDKISKKDNKHPIFVHNSEKDTYHVMDGNHRVSAARLKGDKHIFGKVFSPKWEVYKPRDMEKSLREILCEKRINAN